MPIRDVREVTINSERHPELNGCTLQIVSSKDEARFFLINPYGKKISVQVRSGQADLDTIIEKVAGDAFSYSEGVFKID